MAFHGLFEGALTFAYGTLVPAAGSAGLAQALKWGTAAALIR